ncbi:Spy/CpxP family protein refolding chaperone [Methylocystis bryophila]|uniref:LTXXQ motif family protein n=1 Tax=Methylocystis bryophila TaxID=655015 RepID=A0A1W6N0K4_9HYPH|nr:Spy/CpxP family protein refolding chaperone [Methylocystis bryophila]ARN83355.1 hypothetical protein B1812_03995 [Methylocystis bryophila]
MNKRLAIALTAAALLLPQLPPAATAAPEEEHGGWKLSEEDKSAFLDARVAALKAGLKLTPAQEKNWPPVEAAIREFSKAKAARKAEWHEKFKEQEGHRNFIEGLQFHAKTMEILGGDLGKLADAAKPLYESLDDAQKHRLVILVHHMRHEHEHMGHWGEHSGDHED